jgi:hypothetical protein
VIFAVFICHQCPYVCDQQVPPSQHEYDELMLFHQICTCTTFLNKGRIQCRCNTSSWPTSRICWVINQLVLKMYCWSSWNSFGLCTLLKLMGLEGYSAWPFLEGKFSISRFCCLGLFSTSSARMYRVISISPPPHHPHHQPLQTSSRLAKINNPKTSHHHHHHPHHHHHHPQPPPQNTSTTYSSIALLL